MKTMQRITTTLLAVAVLGTPLATMAGKQGKGAGRQVDAVSSLDATEIALSLEHGTRLRYRSQ